MIKTLDVELKILVYILSFGIYYFAASDLLIYIVDRNKKKKIVKILFEIIYLISQVYITFNFCYNLDNGYIPIYFMIFIIIGFMLYYLFMRNYFIKCLDFVFKIYDKITPKFIHLLYSVTLFKNKIKSSKLRGKLKRKKNINSMSQNT
jgi:hypothetical protein